MAHKLVKATEVNGKKCLAWLLWEYFILLIQTGNLDLGHKLPGNLIRSFHNDEFIRFLKKPDTFV